LNSISLLHLLNLAAALNSLKKPSYVPDSFYLACSKERYDRYRFTLCSKTLQECELDWCREYKMEWMKKFGACTQFGCESDPYAGISTTATTTIQTVPTPAPPPTPPPVSCSEEGQNCHDSKCCKNPNLVCYEKDQWWATCKAACTPGIDPHDNPDFATPWSCDVLSTAPVPCSPAGQNCHASKCCEDASLTCYEKDDYWASCKPSCTPGIDPNDPAEYQTPWTCDIIGNSPESTLASAPTELAYTCGDYNSEDCNNEYNNGVNNGDLQSGFCNRCATEGGANPLRSRCQKCCDECLGTLSLLNSSIA